MRRVRSLSACRLGGRYPDHRHDDAPEHSPRAASPAMMSLLAVAPEAIGSGEINAVEQDHFEGAAVFKKACKQSHLEQRTPP